MKETNGQKETKEDKRTHKIILKKAIKENIYKTKEGKCLKKSLFNKIEKKIELQGAKLHYVAWLIIALQSL